MPKFIVKIQASLEGEVQLTADTGAQAYDLVRRAVAKDADTYRTLIHGGVGNLRVLRDVKEVQPEPPSLLREDGRVGNFGEADYITKDSDA
jgi:hypothetical protein